MLIEINRYAPNMQILALDLKDKERLYIMLEIDINENTKKNVVVSVESESENNVKVFKREQVAYVNDNYN